MGSTCLALLVISLYTSPLTSQFIYMTHWGNQLAILSNFLGYYAGRYKQTPKTIEELKGVEYYAHLALEFSVVMGFKVSLIYWFFIHWHIIPKLYIDEGPVSAVTTILVHFCPLVGSLINALITRTRYVNSHYIYCLPIGIVYAAFNYMGTRYHGKPMYPFMNWEDAWTLVNSVVLIGISML